MSTKNLIALTNAKHVLQDQAAKNVISKCVEHVAAEQAADVTTVNTNLDNVTIVLHLHVEACFQSYRCF